MWEAAMIVFVCWVALIILKILGKVSWGWDVVLAPVFYVLIFVAWIVLSILRLFYDDS